MTDLVKLRHPDHDDHVIEVTPRKAELLTRRQGWVRLDAPPPPEQVHTDDDPLDGPEA